MRSRQIEQKEIENIHTWDLGGVVGGYWIPIMTICRSEGTGLHKPPPNTKATKEKYIIQFGEINCATWTNREIDQSLRIYFFREGSLKVNQSD